MTWPADAMDAGPESDDAWCIATTKGADVTTVLIRGAELEVPEMRSPAARAPAIQTVEPARVRPEDVGVPVDEGAASSPPIDIVDQWGMQSFPASDPPANW
ncbi:hypothetical protein [Geodermatophilus sp. URMC 64]